MDRVWLRHPETDGYFHCPARAVGTWIELGWQRSDPPPEPANPAVVERIAWEREQDAARERESKPTTTARQVSRKSKEEMTDG